MLLGSLLDLQNRETDKSSLLGGFSGIKENFVVADIDIPFKHQGLEIGMTAFKTLVLAGTFLSDHKSCQESDEEGDDGCAQTGH